MKITKITTYRLPPRWMFLKIETDEGVVGWGEPVIEGRARADQTGRKAASRRILSWRSDSDERHCRDRPGVMGYQR